MLQKSSRLFSLHLPKHLQQSAQLRQSHVHICRHALSAGIPTATESTESASSKAPAPMPDNTKAKQRATRGFRKLMHAYFKTTRYKNESGAVVPLYDPDATDAKANIKWSTLMRLPVGASYHMQPFVSTHTGAS